RADPRRLLPRRDEAGVDALGARRHERRHRRRGVDGVRHRHRVAVVRGRRVAGDVRRGHGGGGDPDGRGRRAATAAARRMSTTMRRRSSWLGLVLLLLVTPALPGVTVAPAFRAEKLREIDATIEEAIAAKKLPGGVLWIEHRREIYHRAYGNRALVPDVEPMTEDTVFDAASLTKVIATAPSIWLLIRDGKVALDGAHAH